jgi:hypothetical protein
LHNFLLLLGLSSSSSESNVTPENDDSHSRDSVSIPNAELSSSGVNTNSKPSIDQATPDEEEGEIKDDDDDDENEENNSHHTDIEPTTPSLPAVKKSTNKTSIKPNKKPGAPKKRKIEQIKTELIQEQDDIDNSTLAKRKKR